MTTKDASDLQKALGDSFEVFEAHGTWLVRRRGYTDPNFVTRAENLYRQVMERRGASVLREDETRPFWNSLLADIPGLED